MAAISEFELDRTAGAAASSTEINVYPLAAFCFSIDNQKGANQ
jgi:hypothetical protein